MAKEFEIDSIINPTIIYSFSDNLLEEDDVDIESDLYKIQIFDKHYLIAMGKGRSDLDDDIVYFVAYLVYEDKVVSKLGIYEKKISSSDKEAIDRKTFDFTEQDLILLNKYIVNKELLEPYKYIKQVSKPNLKILIGKDNEFLVDNARQNEIVKEIKDIIQIPVDLTDKENDTKSKFFYKYFIKTKDSTKNKRIIQSIKILLLADSQIFKFENRKMVSSKIFTEIKENFIISYTQLLALEYILQVKVLLIVGNNIQFNIVGERKIDKMAEFHSSMKNQTEYINFNPKSAIFVTNDGGVLKALTLNGEFMIDFKTMNYELLKKVYNSFEDDLQEQGGMSYTNDTRYKYLTNAAFLNEGVEETKQGHEPNDDYIKDIDGDDDAEDDDAGDDDAGDDDAGGDDAVDDDAGDDDAVDDDAVDDDAGDDDAGDDDAGEDDGADEVNQNTQINITPMNTIKANNIQTNLIKPTVNKVEEAQIRMREKRVNKLKRQLENLKTNAK
jgi:hypothetical protein